MKRRIKIEERGDYFRKQTIPTVRLKGKWLQAAGMQCQQKSNSFNLEKSSLMYMKLEFNVLRIKKIGILKTCDLNCWYYLR